MFEKELGLQFTHSRCWWSIGASNTSRSSNYNSSQSVSFDLFNSQVDHILRHEVVLTGKKSKAGALALKHYETMSTQGRFRAGASEGEGLIFSLDTVFESLRFRYTHQILLPSYRRFHSKRPAHRRRRVKEIGKTMRRILFAVFADILYLIS